MQVNDSTGQKQLLYQGEKEIGSIQSGRIKELRLVHPNASQEYVFTLEIDQQTFFPVQDYRNNISALYRQDGSIAQWYRYSSFGLQSTNGIENLSNPWRFANRREIAGLSLFTHRLYHPGIRRWLTIDPLGFEDGFNLYAYVHNNPFRYTDPDGQYAIQLIQAASALGEFISIILFPAIEYTAYVAVGTFVAWKTGEYLSDQINKNDNEAFEEENRAENPVTETIKPQPKPKKRTEPRNLGEQLTLEEAKAKPRNPDDEIMPDKINDPRYPHDTWKKNAHVHTNPDGTKTDIHYWENRITGEKEDFKFKDY